jgi:hypothetical protein
MFDSPKLFNALIVVTWALICLTILSVLGFAPGFLKNAEHVSILAFLSSLSLIFYEVRKMGSMTDQVTVILEGHMEPGAILPILTDYREGYNERKWRMMIAVAAAFILCVIAATID